MPTSPLADFALAAAAAAHAPGATTAYTYATTLVDGIAVPQVGLGTPATVLTDCSGWVGFALASVAPLQAAVAMAERRLPLFNPAEPVQAYNPADPAQPIPVTLAEQEWPWARADVLTHLFDTADGSNGFREVGNFARLQAGDLIAWSLGIYADPGNPDSASQPGLLATPDTGHTMVVVGRPVAVPMEVAASATLSAAAVQVFAVPVVDSSSVPHMGAVTGASLPLADNRDYAALPPGVTDAQPGGLGTGTLWFAVDAAGAPIQFRFGAGDAWFAHPATPADPDADALTVIAAARPTGSIALAGDMLNSAGQLAVDTYPNAAPGFGGTGQVTAKLTGAGGLLLGTDSTLALEVRSSFTGGITLGDGSTLALDAAGAAGRGAITFAAGADATLRLGAGLRLPNDILGFDAGDVIDLAGVQASGLKLGAHGALRVLRDGADPLVLHFAPGTVGAGEAFAFADDGSGGTLITLAAAAADALWA